MQLSGKARCLRGKGILDRIYEFREFYSLLPFLGLDALVVLASGFIAVFPDATNAQHARPSWISRRAVGLPLLVHCNDLATFGIVELATIRIAVLAFHKRCRNFKPAISIINA